MQERILAEAELQPENEHHPATIYRLLREETNYYVTEYREGETFKRFDHRTLEDAIWDFKKAVVQGELDSLAEEIAKEGGH